MNPLFDLFSASAAEHAPALIIETDLPLFIQGCVMIALAVIPLFLAGRDKRKSDAEENRHDEHMASLIVQGMRDQHRDDEAASDREGSK